MKNLLAKSTKCLLVYPKFSSHSFWNYSDVCKFVGAKYPAAPLGLMTVAALLPQYWEFKLIDENVKPLIDADLEWADIVLVSGMLPQQKKILDIIQKSHDKSKFVVVGGPDATSQPHIYEKADFLVLGEGEVTIPLFIEDLGKNVTSGKYQLSQRADMTKAVVPRFDLINFSDYLHVGIQFCRGCPFNCEFCDIIELFGRKPRSKTPYQMLAELQTLYDLGYRGHIDFVDDNFIGHKSKVIDVLKAIGDWSRNHNYPFYFSTEASINLVKEEKLLQLMKDNDFRYVFVGIESPDKDVLIQTQKPQNKDIPVTEAIRTLNSHGMIVNGGFILGFDNETESTAKNMINLIQDTGICMAMVGMLAALPNTQLFHRLKREGRLFGGNQVRINGTDDIDQTTSGLNFTTIRPRTAIMKNQVEVLQQIYDPKKYYERVLLTATHLKPTYKNRLSFTQAQKLGWAFLKVSAKAGFNKRTGYLYWMTLLKTLMRNPKAVEAVVNLAAIYIHFSKQSEFVIQMLKDKIAYVDSYGEENYNKMMIIK